jgi:hypothetical protein
LLEIIQVVDDRFLNANEVTAIGAPLGPVNSGSTTILRSGTHRTTHMHRLIEMKSRAKDMHGF